jgi:hypothetical protein
MFDGEATKRALDQRLQQRGYQWERYRRLLLAVLQAEIPEYDLVAARKRTLALVRSTYREMRREAMDVGFSQDFSITLTDMSTRANLDLGPDREDHYLYMMKSTAKTGLGSLTEAQLEEEVAFKVQDAERGAFDYRVYANLTDQGADYVWDRQDELANLGGVAAYKFAFPDMQWRRDTMVTYCKTAPAAGRVLRWFYGLQTELDDPETYFAADVPHFTTPAPMLRGVSAAKDPDSSARTSYSQRMSTMVRTAIVTGAPVIEPTDDPIPTFTHGIVTRLNQFWDERQKMRGKPKP